MRKQLRFTGVGGQGVLLAGEILARAYVRAGKYGIQVGTYTSQVRGGPTKVDIILDDEPILYPYAVDGEIDFMLSVADKSYQLFKEGVKEGGIIVYEPNLVYPSDDDKAKWKMFAIDIIDIAKEKVGNVITQSVVALAIATKMNDIDKDMVYETMIQTVPPKAVEINKKAFELGFQAAVAALEKENS
ncbi:MULTISPECIES: 2-oxoacid:acceptor oxidoreductase family protein [unclassified Lebetimonas]|uniref:2-oxoacid:acceptor oxidoreductase family protein n=1 Tax=unclassified Lebetimonas TaxID=2648158 RepID=UPI0004633EF6|nr:MULTISPECIES: 2-oxoacid:acceptor oxidoreductase family protein [unclassified Lebetimonas]